MARKKTHRRHLGHAREKRAGAERDGRAENRIDRGRPHTHDERATSAAA
jgi:hypothetical protein